MLNYVTALRRSNGVKIENDIDKMKLWIYGSVVSVRLMCYNTRRLSDVIALNLTPIFFCPYLQVNIKTTRYNFKPAELYF